MHDGLRRVAGILLLAIVFLGLMGHYAGTAPQHELTQQSVTKLESPDEHVGETIHVWGTVERNDEILVVSNVGDRGPVTVMETETTAQPDDSIQIYGTIRPDGTVAADRVIVSERTSLRRLYAVSLVALALTIVVFFRSWSVDLRRLTFAPREDGDGA